MHRETFVAGDAGTVAVEIDGRGARVAGIDAGPGWTVAEQFPRRWKRRRPTQAVAVYLRRGACHQWEIEVSLPADGIWEAALNEQWPDQRPGSVVTPGGTVRLAWDDGGVHLDKVAPVAGWVSRVEDDDGDDAFVSFCRGTETWEVLVMAEYRERGNQTVVQREHSWRLGVGPAVGAVR